MSSLTLDAEALYRDLLNAVRLLMASYSEPVWLVGVASGGVWLAERLHSDLKLSGKSEYCRLRCTAMILPSAVWHQAARHNCHLM